MLRERSELMVGLKILVELIAETRVVRLRV